MVNILVGNNKGNVYYLGLVSLHFIRFSVSLTVFMIAN